MNEEPDAGSSRANVSGVHAMANAVVETHEEGTMIERATSGPQKMMQFLRDTRQEDGQGALADAGRGAVNDHRGDRDGISVCGVF